MNSDTADQAKDTVSQDSLFRVSIKAIIQNDKGEFLCVKEAGRGRWDFPGGGLEEGENVQTALQRELKEEVGYVGAFTYEPFGVDEPHFLDRGVWQLRIVCRVAVAEQTFSVGEDADEIAWKKPDEFENSESGAERLICFYARKLRGDTSYDAYMPVNETH